MRRHVLFAAVLVTIGSIAGGLSAGTATAKTKPKSRGKIITVGGPSIQKYQLTVVGTYTATDGLGKEMGTISVPKIAIQVVTVQGVSTPTGTGQGRVTGTLETLQMSPPCKTPANGVAVIQVMVVPLMSQSPPTTIPENPVSGEQHDELDGLPSRKPVVGIGKVGFSLIGFPTAKFDEGPSVPCGGSTSKLVFGGMLAVAALANSSTSNPFLIFSQRGERLDVSKSDGPITYNLRYTLVRL